MLNEKHFKIGRISLKEGLQMRFSVVVIFWLEGHGNSLDEAEPSIFSDTTSTIFGLSNDILFLKEFN